MAKLTNQDWKIMASNYFKTKRGIEGLPPKDFIGIDWDDYPETEKMNHEERMEWSLDELKKALIVEG